MSRPPRVLHAPIDVANQAARSARGLREVGVPATCFAAPHAFDYDPPPDVVPPTRRLPFLRVAGRMVRGHDVLHFHYGQSLVRESLGALDARAARRARRRVVVEFHGSDVRMPSVEQARNPHYVRLPGEDDEVAERRMHRWAAITGGHVVQCDHSLDAFLSRHFAHVHVVGHRVDARRIAPAFPRLHARTPVIAHAPSDAAGKGTRFVREAVAALRAEGVPVEYVEIRGRRQRDALEACRGADLVIDQLCAGSHGVFAVEAMALGKPVVCYLLPEIAARFPADLPLIQATPSTLRAVLADWLPRSGDLHERGRASRAYAEREHDLRVVARRLLDVYSELPR